MRLKKIGRSCSYLCCLNFVKKKFSIETDFSLFNSTASAHTGDTAIDEYPDISGITTARVSFNFDSVFSQDFMMKNNFRKRCVR